MVSEEGELALVKATPEQFTRARPGSGDRGQDVEPPGAGRRRPAGTQRRGDGRVPVVPGRKLIVPMGRTHEPQPPSRKPLRLWPGVIAAVALVLFKLVAIPVVAPGAPPVGLLGGLVAALAIVVWWVFFSRAPWSERVGAIVLMVVALFATSRVLHESIATAPGGMLFPILALPALSFALVVWAVVSRRLSSGPRRASMVATILLTCGVFALLRTGGFSGNGEFEFHWRWTPTPEQRLLAQAGQKPLDVTRAAPARRRHPQHHLNHGRNRPSPRLRIRLRHAPSIRQNQNPTRLCLPSATEESRETNGPAFAAPLATASCIVRINTDWATSPPVEMWRRPIGPGWSSFAVHGDLLYTQEQRGDDEMVACYRVSTGEPVWRHRYPVRFWEPGAAPVRAGRRRSAVVASTLSGRPES